MPSTSTNMGMVLPTVLVDVGPTWASELFTALNTVIDAHDHSPGKGVKVTQAGLNFTADLTFGGFNATSLRSTRFSPVASALVLGADVGCLYDVNNSGTALGDAFWNNAAGTAIQLTKSGQVNPPSFLNAKVTISASTYSLTAAEVFGEYWVNASSNTVAITLPAASTVTAGRYAFFFDYTGSSETNAITFIPTGTDKIANVNGTYTWQKNLGFILLASDGVSNWAAVPSGFFNQPWQGTRNTQQGVVQTYPWQKNTTASTAQTTSFTYTLPSNSSVTFVVEFSARQTGTPADVAGGSQVFIATNSAGTVTTASASASTASSGASPFTSLSLTVAGAVVTLNVTASTASSVDWMGTVRVLGN